MKPPATPPPAASMPPKKRWLPRIDGRWLAPLLITAILVVGNYSYGISENLSSPLLSRLTNGWISTYSPTLVAILTALVAELILSRLVVGKWPHLASAYISGISVGILIRSPEVWPYVMCSLISITSKYAIRWRGRHLWNPSNLGVSVMLFLAQDEVAALSLQWSNQFWPLLVIWVLGCLILYKVGRLHVTLTYAAAFVLLALVRSVATHTSWLTQVAPLTGPMYQLFIFFMITDPRTTPRTKLRQCAVVIVVAVVETVFRLYGQKVYEPLQAYAPFYALFLVGPIALVLDMWWDGPKAKKPVAVPAAA
jgi:Na+-translocating ferredoxin:NAD+ oxidoreductase RnfD subunit